MDYDGFIIRFVKTVEKTFGLDIDSIHPFDRDLFIETVTDLIDEFYEGRAGEAASQGYDEGQQDGYSEGYNQGRQDGYDESWEDMRSKLLTFMDSLD